MAQYAAALHHHDFDFDGPLLPPRARVVDAGNLPRADDALLRTGPGSEGPSLPSSMPGQSRW